MSVFVSYLGVVNTRIQFFPSSLVVYHQNEQKKLIDEKCFLRSYAYEKKKKKKKEGYITESIMAAVALGLKKKVKREKREK